MLDDTDFAQRELKRELRNAFQFILNIFMLKYK